MHDSLAFPQTGMERIADTLAQQEFVVLDHFLSESEALDLRAALEQHRAEDNFSKAGVGKHLQHQILHEVRGDYLKWIEEREALPATRHFLQKVSVLASGLSAALRISLQDFECHFAIYPPGSFYEKHIDCFRSDGNRVLSLACYLNAHWEPAHAGEIQLYPPTGESPKVAPLLGRLVLFRSDSLLHEVLTTAVDRYSITGWLLQQPKDLPFGI